MDRRLCPHAFSPTPDLPRGAGYGEGPKCCLASAKTIAEHPALLKANEEEILCGTSYENLGDVLSVNLSCQFVIGRKLSSNLCGARSEWLDKGHCDVGLF